MVFLEHLEKQILSELQVDRVFDDVTVRLLGDGASRSCEAFVFAKSEGVFSLVSIPLAFKRLFKDELDIEIEVENGQKIEKGQRLITIKGPIGLCLGLERTLLNYLTHLSGVSTLTRKFVEQVSGTKTKILATRKTLPGMRELQLEAVRAGGGHVHRRSLSDGILIKDNHIAMSSIGEILARSQSNRSPLHRVEIEVQSFEQVKEALSHSPDIMMLDNLSHPDMKSAIELIRNHSTKKIEIEASGGVSLNNVREIASLGVDYISVGALTHSAPQLDLSMDFF